MKNALNQSLVFIRQHILPHIIDAVEDCNETYQSSDFNDSWVFGTQFWKNQWNRICSLADEQSNLTVYKSKYFFTINGITFRCHKNNPITGVPTGAKAAKEEAQQCFLPGLQEYIEENIASGESYIVGVDATPEFGLNKVFVGQIGRDASGKNKFFWYNTHTIFDPKQAFISHEENVPVPAEKEARPSVSLNKKAKRESVSK